MLITYQHSHSVRVFCFPYYLLGKWAWDAQNVERERSWDSWPQLTIATFHTYTTEQKNLICLLRDWLGIDLHSLGIYSPFFPLLNWPYQHTRFPSFALPILSSVLLEEGSEQAVNKELCGVQLLARSTNYKRIDEYNVHNNFICSIVCVVQYRDVFRYK